MLVVCEWASQMDYRDCTWRLDDFVPPFEGSPLALWYTERANCKPGTGTAQMEQPTPEEMAKQVTAAHERLWWTLSLLEPQEMETGAMADGWSPKVLIGQIAAWNIIHTRRMIKMARPDLVSFIERANGGLMQEEELARLRARDPMRAAVDARLPLDAVLSELERAQTWTTGFLTDESSDLHRYLVSETAEPEVFSIFDAMLGEMRQRTRTLRRWCGSMRRWKKQDLLALLEAQHELLMESIAGLDETTILTTITHEPWSMRDELVHVLAWNEFGLILVDAWPNTKKDDALSWLNEAGESEDEINERLHAERINMNMIEVVDALATVHRRTIKRLEAADDVMLASEADWFFGASGELAGFVYAMAIHQAEHSEWLWRTRLALEE